MILEVNIGYPGGKGSVAVAGAGAEAVVIRESWP